MRRRLIALFFVAACDASGGAPGPTCTDVLPDACPTPATTYDGAAANVVNAKCVPCHHAGGAASDKPLDTYERVFKRRSAVLNQVNACFMPAKGGAPLTAEERLTLLTWLVCGAPLQ